MISVVIPAFNEEKYLPRLLSSLKKQTLEWGRDFEVIVVDARSLDRTREVAKSFGCRVIVEKKRKGPGQARNLGAKKAKGDIIVFLDADAIAFPSLLERLEKRIRAGAGLATSYILPDGPYSWAAPFVNIPFHVLTLMGFPHVGGYCIAVKKDLFMEAGMFRTDVKLAEDHLLAMEIKKYAPVSYVTETLLVVSSRRARKSGLFFPIWQFVYTLIHLLLRVPIRSFNYEFGVFK